MATVKTKPKPSQQKPAAAAELEATFHALVAEWRRDTAPLSSVQDMVLHPAYQRIIGLGPDAIPLVLQELLERRDHWFWALRALTGVDPTGDDDRGRIGRMADSWLEWGRQCGYLE